jgi:hypothetical protein
MDQRKKGSKPPFFKNNLEGQQAPREPKTIEIRGQKTKVSTYSMLGF